MEVKISGGYFCAQVWFCDVLLESAHTARAGVQGMYEK